MLHLKYFKESTSPIISDIDIEWVRSHFDEESFGSFEGHIDPDRGSIDMDISKCLKLGDEIIGCYCLQKLSILEIIERVKYWTEEDESPLYKDLKFFFKDTDLFENKLGIFGDYLYILPEYRSKKHADILIEYSKTLGDYNWGITSGYKPEKYWIENKGRTRICEYTEMDGTINIINSTIPN